MPASVTRTRKRDTRKTPPSRKPLLINSLAVSIAVLLSVYVLFGYSVIPVGELAHSSTQLTARKPPPPPPTLNKVAYNEKLLALAHLDPPPGATTTAATTITSTSTQYKPLWPAKPLWPVKAVYPDYGALLPFNRIVAYYGNFYSKQMGVLGEYPPDVVLAKLRAVAAQWRAADPSTPVIPAIDYIAVTAQDNPGKDGMYRLRMPDSQIDKALHMANELHGLLFLDIQVGKSTLEKEIPLLKKYLKLPNVELSIDPEFSMAPSGRAPGTVIGTFDAKDINYTAHYLAGLVEEYNLPPKILVVHRFTQDMVTNTQDIKPLPQVQIVMDMDGWGSPARKMHTYHDVIYKEPVQFTGFKLFYKNDKLPPSPGMMTPQEVLRLTPEPSYIQYQ